MNFSKRYVLCTYALVGPDRKGIHEIFGPDVQERKGWRWIVLYLVFSCTDEERVEDAHGSKVNRNSAGKDIHLSSGLATEEIANDSEGAYFDPREGWRLECLSVKRSGIAGDYRICPKLTSIKQITVLGPLRYIQYPSPHLIWRAAVSEGRATYQQRAYSADVRLKRRGGRDIREMQRSLPKRRHGDEPIRPRDSAGMRWCHLETALAGPSTAKDIGSASVRVGKMATGPAEDCRPQHEMIQWCLGLLGAAWSLSEFEIIPGGRRVVPESRTEHNLLTRCAIGMVPCCLSSKVTEPPAGTTHRVAEECPAPKFYSVLFRLSEAKIAKDRGMAGTGREI
ncbi:hypothetical protein DFH07DRAFT_946989 [Mycena maculata]|uniref:Uncharacterized protein n=1 Tax=Mycena maculata TaxID=230809 RepID=A0AAD7MJN6_9AGAR|nr:hypothetical protein DFH07DRAFT_946989 [Mycena maculata]